MIDDGRVSDPKQIDGRQAQHQGRDEQAPAKAGFDWRAERPKIAQQQVRIRGESAEGSGPSDRRAGTIANRPIAQKTAIGASFPAVNA